MYNVSKALPPMRLTGEMAWEVESHQRILDLSIRLSSTAIKERVKDFGSKPTSRSDTFTSIERTPFGSFFLAKGSGACSRQTGLQDQDDSKSYRSLGTASLQIRCSSSYFVTECCVDFKVSPTLHRNRSPVRIPRRFEATVEDCRTDSFYPPLMFHAEKMFLPLQPGQNLG